MDIEEKAVERDKLIQLTADIVVSYVGNNACHVDNLPALIQNVHDALQKIENSKRGAAAERSEEEKKKEAAAAQSVIEKLKPAVHPKRSVGEDYIICLEDGKKFRSLKRHLMSHYGLSPQQYRKKWGLAADYPMVAPSYARSRSQLAKKMGLGQKNRKYSEHT